MDISIQTLKINNDKRGTLVEFLTAKEINKYKAKFGHSFFATFENERAIRGNHYHVKQNEYYCILHGKIVVFLKDIKTGETKKVVLSAENKKFKKLRIGPNIVHACYNLSPKAILLGYFSLPYDVVNNDTIPYILVK